MKVSAIASVSECNPRRNMFIRFSNSFMSAPTVEDPVEKAGAANSVKAEAKTAKLGIENLQEFTIFPKEVIDGKTIITA